MSNRELVYLNEMGIDVYQLSRPQCLTGYSQPDVTLPEACELLLVSSKPVEGSELLLLENILKAMSLDRNQVRVVLPEHVSQFNLQSLNWLWYCGCNKDSVPFANKILHSPELAVIANNTLEKRALWQQIRTLL